MLILIFYIVLDIPFRFTILNEDLFKIVSPALKIFNNLTIFITLAITFSIPLIMPLCSIKIKSNYLYILIHELQFGINFYKQRTALIDQL